MRKLLLLAIVIACIQGYFFLRPRMYRYELNDPNANITIYGNEGCSVCEYLRSALSENQIQHEYKDVIKNDSYNQELWQIIRRKYDKDPSFHLPVVVMNDEILFYFDYKRFLAEYATERFVLFD